VKRLARAVGWPSAHRPPARYAAAAVVALAAVGLGAIVTRWLQMPFFPVCVGAVAISAAFGGTGPGLVTAILAGIGVTASSPRLPAGREILLVGAYAVVGAVVAHAAGWWRGAFFATIERRRDTARAIRDRLEFLRGVTRAMDEGVYALDREGHITYVNAAAERMLGYRQAEVVGLTVKEAFRCRRLDGTCSGRRCRLTQVIATGEPLRGADDLLSRKDGTCFPVRYSSAPLVRGGRTVGAVVAFQDVTEERRQEARDRFLATATAELAASIDYEETLARVARLALPFLGDWSMTVVVDPDGAPRRVAVETSSPAHAEIAREMLQRYPIDLEADHGAGRVIRTGEPELLPDVADDTWEGGTTARTRSEMLRRLGLRSFIAVPLRARGRIIGALDFGVIDSERRFGPADLALALELAGRCALAIDNARLHREARDALAAREHMLAVVSHDLRNPIGAIQMAASIIPRIAADEARRDRAEQVSTTIARACDRMNRMVGDLVDIASIDAGLLSVERASLSVDALVAESVEAARPAADAAGVELTWHPPDERMHAIGDHDRLQQVLGNLLSNAIQVTPRGGRVWVRHRRRGDGALLSVSDTGPGIPREQQARIFAAYERGAGVGYRGTGLGLSIAKGIVEAHGGRLWVVSRAGRGATFRLVVPALRAAGERAPRAGPEERADEVA
jgi:PAS domain S-box-containing protein